MDRSLSLAEMPLLNGRFDHCPDNTSITSADFIGIVHSLVSLGTNGAGTISRQSFTTGQTAVPGNPTYFLRWAETTAPDAGTPEFLSKIEDVRTFAGKKVCVQGFYRSNTPFDMKFKQDFGAGGSPSADVLTSASGPTNTLPTTVDSAGTAQWKPFTMWFDVPTLYGKTIGSTANSSYVGVSIRPPIGSTFQIDITDLAVHVGGERIPVDRRRPVYEEENLLERYYASLTAYAPVSTQSANWVPFRRKMASAPTMSGGTGSTVNGSTVDGFKIISSGAAAAITAIVAAARIAD
jgi:hypothetical protein